jgi:hypothetical protein
MKALKLAGALVGAALLLPAGAHAATLTNAGGTLTYCGCTADAEIVAEIFGGDLTANFGPVLFGSQREILAGIVRALPDPDSSASVRAVQVARRLPKAARGSKPHMIALCEVGEMLAERLGLPSAVHRLFATLTERWDGKGQLRRAEGMRSRPRCESPTSPETPPSSICWEGWSGRQQSSASAQEVPSTPRSPAASRTTRQRS